MRENMMILKDEKCVDKNIENMVYSKQNQNNVSNKVATRLHE